MYKFINNIKQKYNIRLTLILPYLIGASLFIILPMILLLVKSVQPVNGHTFLEQAQDNNMWKSIGRSVYLGILAAFISLVLLFPFTWIIARSKSRTLSFIAFVLIISPLFIFTISKVFSLKILLLKIFNDGNIIPIKKSIMVFGMVYLYSPFMIIPLYSVFKNIPESLLEASEDLGFSKYKTIYKVVIPYSLKAIFSGFGVVFMLSATSLVITNTLVPAAGSRINDINNVLIGNVLDVKAGNMITSAEASQQGSTIALITIAVMMLVYGIIYLIPLIIIKIKGGANV